MTNKRTVLLYTIIRLIFEQYIVKYKDAVLIYCTVGRTNFSALNLLINSKIKNKIKNG